MTLDILGWGLAGKTHDGGAVFAIRKAAIPQFVDSSSKFFSRSSAIATAGRQPRRKLIAGSRLVNYPNRRSRRTDQESRNELSAQSNIAWPNPSTGMRPSNQFDRRGHPWTYAVNPPACAAGVQTRRGWQHRRRHSALQSLATIHS